MSAPSRTPSLPLILDDHDDNVPIVDAGDSFDNDEEAEPWHEELTLLEIQQPHLPDPRNDENKGTLDFHVDAPAAAAGAKTSVFNFLDTKCDTTAARRALYATAFLGQWGWRTWEFAVALILIELYPDTLLLVSLYGLLDALVKLVSGSAIGTYIDRTERWPAARSMYFLQNSCIAASAVSAALLILLGDGTVHQAGKIILTACTIGLGALSSAGSIGVSIAVERDWTKALCGSDAAALASMNSVMRRIDLVCLMLAPIVSGLLMTYISMLVAVLIITCYNAAAWLPETRLLRVAQQHSVALQKPKHSEAQQDATSQHHQSTNASVIGLIAPAVQKPIRNLVTGWATYIRQPVLLPAVALAMLYFTVLSLGFLMTAYVKQHGLTEVVVSIFRAAGAVTGILATFLYPWLHSKVGILATGIVGIGYQLLCLLVAVMPVVLGQAAGFSSWSTSGLLYCTLAGVAASRTGLWMFDLAVSQLLQDEVPQHELGVVNGVQGSLQSAFEIGSFVMGMLVPQPEHFHWLMLASCGAVAAAAAVFAKHVLSESVSYRPVLERKSDTNESGNL